MTRRPHRTGRFRRLIVAVVRRRGVRRRRGAALRRDDGPSPRDGVQPLEFMDEAYYAILGADLAETGTETMYSPSGFTRHPGSAAPDLVPLGRDVARLRRRSRSSAPSPSTPATSIVLPLAAAGGSGPDGHARPADDRVDVPRRLPLRVLRLPVPRPGADLGPSHDLRDHACTASRPWRSCSACTVGGPRRRPASWALRSFVGSAAAVILPSHVVDRAARRGRRRGACGHQGRPSLLAARRAADRRRSRRRGRSLTTGRCAVVATVG